jgi:hypothetical protein
MSADSSKPGSKGGTTGSHWQRLKNSGKRGLSWAEGAAESSIGGVKRGSAKVADAVTEGVEALGDGVKRRSGEVASAIAASAATLGAHVRDHTGKVADAVAENVAVVGDGVKRHFGNVANTVAESATTVGSQVKRHSGKVADAVAENVGALGAFLAAPELLKWSEGLTQSAATIYDRSLDAEYLRTHIGGGVHRMFDGGQDLWGAWTRVKDASSDDTFLQEVAGYAGALWKDLTTTNGLPVVTWDQAGFERFAERLGSVPGVSKAWIYDAVSYDAFEVLSAGLGAVGLIFALQKDALTRLSEMLGSMGITALISANPVMGLSIVATTGYAYWKAQSRGEAVAIDATSAIRGAALGATSAAIFAVLAGPVVIKLVVAIAVTGFLRHHLTKRATDDEAVSGLVLVEGVAGVFVPEPASLAGDSLKTA